MKRPSPEGRVERRRLWRWIDALEQCALIAAAAVLLANLPLPQVNEWLHLKNVVLAAAAVLLIGKTLYDTLFVEG